MASPDSLDRCLKQLEQAGTAQNRKVYARHGVGPMMFGVSFAHQKRLSKTIGTDQKLAEQLWQTGNHDARILATMVADAKTITPRTLDSWAKNLDNYVISDALSGLVAKTPFAAKTMRKWIRSASDWIGRSGWQLLSHLAMEDSQIEEAEFSRLLDKIADTIHQRKNFTRHAMNNALIAIGVRNPALTRQALRACNAIGEVEVDHGQTSCKTPDAAAYIQKTLQWRKSHPASNKECRKQARGNR